MLALFPLVFTMLPSGWHSHGDQIVMRETRRLAMVSGWHSHGPREFGCRQGSSLPGLISQDDHSRSE